MDTETLIAILGELRQAAPEAERRSAELAQRVAAAAERTAALTSSLGQLERILDAPVAALPQSIAQLAQTSTSTEDAVRGGCDDVAALLDSWASARAADQAALEAARNEGLMAVDGADQRLRDACEMLAASGQELAQRAAAFLEVDDLAGQRLDAAWEVALEAGAAVRDEAQRAQSVVLSCVHQVADASQDHQERGRASLRATSDRFGEEGDRLASQLERVREDLVGSATHDMTTEVRRALLEETGPSLEAARQTAEEALAGMQRGLAEMREAAVSVRTALAPLMQEVDHLVGALGDTVEFVRDAAHAAGVPF